MSCGCLRKTPPTPMPQDTDNDNEKRQLHQANGEYPFTSNSLKSRQVVMITTKICAKNEHGKMSFGESASHDE
ncbi:hypothetical protein Ddc_01631 [Ditylenchus destructor]|nr:hypothetical protein Ddc_01631 [Ditylenchus destructor]